MPSRRFLTVDDSYMDRFMHSVSRIEYERRDNESIKSIINSMLGNHSMWTLPTKCSDCKYAHKNPDGTYLCKCGEGKYLEYNHGCEKGKRK